MKPALNVRPNQMVQAIFISWCQLQIFTGVIFKKPDNLATFFSFQNAVDMLILFGVLLAVWIIILYRYLIFSSHITIFTFLLYSLLIVVIYQNVILAVVFSLIFSVLFKSLLPNWQPVSNAVRQSRYWFIVCAILFFVFVGGVTALRYLTFLSPCFDLGIFSQMFHQMMKTGLPVTTCERSQVLSHFAVHLSPVYYLLLPVYCLFPNPIILQLSQAAVLAFGAIPLWKLCRHYRLGEWPSRFIALCYFLYPALSGGCFSDIHENMFLAPFLLWLFLASEWSGKKNRWVYLFCLLILTVKEDAAIYPIFFGFYLMLSGKNPRQGIYLIVISAAYFCGAVTYLNNYGQGVMIGRYSNYAWQNGGFLELLGTVFLIPAYVIEQCFQEDRFIYLLEILVPLAFLPLKNRKLASWILLGPLILMNLMPDYIYQHTIDFQYNFGTLSFLFYMMLINLEQMDYRRRFRVALITSVSSLLLLSTSMLYYLSIVRDYVENKAVYNQMESVLNKIPSNNSVTASNELIAHLYEHDELYPLDSLHKTDYVIFHLAGEIEWMIAEDYKNSGYNMVYQDEWLLVLATDEELQEAFGEES